MASDAIEGRCLCGAVRLSVAHAPSATSVCHCAMCRRWGGAAMWGFDATAKALTVEGPVATFRSSPFAERAWCRDCGTHLWFREDGKDFELMPGLFDEAARLPLAREVYADRAFACVPLSGDHVRVTQADYEREQPFVEDKP